jgi:hypothetical protein
MVRLKSRQLTCSHSEITRSLCFRLITLLCLPVFLHSSIPALAQNHRLHDLRLHQIQLIGTHNSYHIAPHKTVADLIQLAGTSVLQGIEYTHKPLPQQLQQMQIRQLELDLFADPLGGLFAKPLARNLLANSNQDPGPDPNADGSLSQPGIKVLHAAGFDYATNVSTLRQALQQIRQWSQAAPHHLPVMILLELKESVPNPAGVRLVRWDTPRLKELDQLIHEIFPPTTRLIPADLRQPTDASVRDAVLKRGWPRLQDLQGKVFFCLDNEGPWVQRYLDAQTHPDQATLFVSADTSHPLAAWFKRNDPVTQFQEIQNLVRQGFLIRTRADADTTQARTNDTSRREQAFASGAQYISTDFPEPVAAFSDYCVRLSDHAPARISPLFPPLTDSPVAADWEAPAPR